MRTSITRLVLEKIMEMGEATIDIFFPPQYSYTRISRNLFGINSYPEIKPRTLSVILSRLQRQGLVVRSGSKRKSSWRLTKEGKGFLKSAKGIKTVVIPDVPKKDGIARLVIFDIPERERKKRDALRLELVACNFERLQKSVWIGHNPLPGDFIALLDELDLKNKVHIFSIREKGTIAEV